MPASTGKIYLGSTQIAGGGGGSTSPEEDWVRPSDWLPLPPLSSPGVVGLAAVYDAAANFVAFTVSGTGNFVVDWGDGSAAEEYAAGAKAEKSLAWSDYNSSTLSSRGYRQAVITVAPAVGGSITAINFAVKPSTPAGVASGGSSSWLDLAINLPGAELTISTRDSGPIGEALHWQLERVSVVAAATGTAFLFRTCRALQSVSLPPTFAIVGDANLSFAFCSALKTAPFFDLSQATSVQSMFAGCVNLRSVPDYNLSQATTTQSMFSGCRSLRTLGAINCPIATTLTSMFQDCSSLESIASLNIPEAITVNSIFAGCTNLRVAPALSLANVTSATGVYNNCNSLIATPPYNLPKATTLLGFFNGCNQLTHIGAITTTTALTNAGSFVLNCYSLRSMPAMVVSAVTSYTSTFTSCPSLMAINWVGINASINISNCRLSADALNAIYSNLSATGSGKTITVTGNYGTATDNPSIATAKGWTVSG
jgi:hypothetical protein